MTALLVDGRSLPSEASELTGFKECFVPHHPGITVKTPSNAECLAADCLPKGEHDCTCSLVRKEVSLHAQLPPGTEKRQINSQPKNGLPFNFKEARDFSYVANLSRLKHGSRLGYELDRERFLNNPNPPPALIARMSFSFESVSACSLGTRRDEGGNNVHPMSFRPIATTEEAGEASQALSQMVAAMFRTDQDPVKLTLTDFGGGNPKTLTLQPINGEYQIELFNMRVSEKGEHDLPPDHPCDGGVERDFAFFYELVKDRPAWDERPIPHVKLTRWKSVKDLEIAECKAHTGDHFPNSHPICGLASFVP
jgi:hypothetical protein